MSSQREYCGESYSSLILFYALLIFLSAFAAFLHEYVHLPIDVLYTLLVMYAIFFSKIIEKWNLRYLGIYISYSSIVFFSLGLSLGFFLILIIFLSAYFLGEFNVYYVGIPSYLILLRHILLFFLIGFSEELIFRAYPIRKLIYEIGTTRSIIASALIFALFHAPNTGFNILALINLLILGSLLGLLYIYTNNIFIITGFHMGWNLFQGIILGLPVSGFQYKDTFLKTIPVNSSISLTGGSFGLEASILTTIIASLSLLILIIISRNLLKNRRM